MEVAGGPLCTVSMFKAARMEVADRSMCTVCTSRVSRMEVAGGQVFTGHIFRMEVTGHPL